MENTQNPKIWETRFRVAHSRPGRRFKWSPSFDTLEEALAYRDRLKNLKGVVQVYTTRHDGFRIVNTLIETTEKPQSPRKPRGPFTERLLTKVAEKAQAPIMALLEEIADQTEVTVEESFYFEELVDLLEELGLSISEACDTAFVASGEAIAIAFGIDTVTTRFEDETEEQDQA